MSESEEVVGGSGRSCRYWSIGSRSKESRYSGMWDRGTWLRRGELFKRRINESGGSRSSVDGRARGFCRVIARDIRHGLVAVMKGAVGEFTIPAMY